MTGLLTSMPLSPKQLLSCRESTARVNLWEGSVRSGKTIASLLRFLLSVATSTVRGELVAVSRTRDSAARNVFAPLMDPSLFGPIAHQVHYVAGDPTATILGRTVWVLRSSDVRSEKLLRGLTCAGAYVDEVTLFREDSFTQLLNRLWEGAPLRHHEPGQPRALVDLPDWRTWKFVLDDNPMLSPERKAAIRRENTGLFYSRNVLGEWVAAEGAIYDIWDPAEHVVPWGQLPAMQSLLGVGVDYDTTNASTGLLLGLGVDQRLYVVDEMAVRRPCRPAAAHRRAAVRVVPDVAGPAAPARLRRPATRFVMVDPAAALFRLQLFNDGLRNVQPADNDAAYGIPTVASGLGSGWLKVSDRRAGFITEAPGYS